MCGIHQEGPGSSAVCHICPYHSEAGAWSGCGDRGDKCSLPAADRCASGTGHAVEGSLEEGYAEEGKVAGQSMARLLKR